MTGVGAFDESGYIGHDECFIAIDRDDTELRFERSERIIRDLRAGRRYAGDQRRFSDVWIADKTYVRQKLQFKAKCLLFS